MAVAYAVVVHVQVAALQVVAIHIHVAVVEAAVGFDDALDGHLLEVDTAFAGDDGAVVDGHHDGLYGVEGHPYQV